MATRYLDKILFPINPSQTPDLTGIFFIFFPRENAVATVSAEVFSPTIISSNFIIFAGEKKCMPSILSGLLITFAISLISR